MSNKPDFLLLIQLARVPYLEHCILMLQVVLPEIHKTFDMPAVSSEARDKLAEVQGQLCGVLQVIVQKLSEKEETKAAVLQFADAVRMSSYSGMLESAELMLFDRSCQFDYQMQWS
jgi:hypothetical protein